MKNTNLSFAKHSNFGKAAVRVLIAIFMLPNLIILPKTLIKSLLIRI
jgi:hypothetical protein